MKHFFALSFIHFFNIKRRLFSSSQLKKLFFLVFLCFIKTYKFFIFIYKTHAKLSAKRLQMAILNMCGNFERCCF